MISVAIQHHPSRSHLLWRTAAAKPEIVVDPDPAGKPDAWRTYLAALERTPAGASHRVIVQDDALLCDGFLSALTLALAVKPESLVALFVPTSMRLSSRRVLAACDADRAWAELDPREAGDWVPVVALAWPARLIPAFLDWTARRGYGPERRRSDDGVVGRFVREMGERVFATVPSLVEHPDDVDSLLKLRTLVPRRAACFAGSRAALIDWTRE